MIPKQDKRLSRLSRGHVSGLFAAMLAGSTWPMVGVAVLSACSGSDNDDELLFIPSTTDGAADSSTGGTAGSGHDGEAENGDGDPASSVFGAAGQPSQDPEGAGLSAAGGEDEAGQDSPANDTPGTGMTSANGGETMDASQQGGASDQVMVAGSYAVRITQRDTITVGLVGTASLRTIVLATAEVEQGPDDRSRTFALTMCDYRVGTGLGEKHLEDLELEIPHDSLAATMFEPATLTLTEADGDITWETSAVRGVAGWTPASATDEPPESPDDPRVVDPDKDGQPGITLVFAGHEEGEVHLAMVFDWVFSGALTADRALVGTTTSQSREALLGSDQNALIVNSFIRVPDPDPTDNTVTFVPQEQAPSCQQLLAEADAIFP